MRYPLEIYNVPFLSQDDSERLDREMPHLPKSPLHCVTCKGTRVFTWYDGLGECIQEFDCNCENQWVVNRYLHHCGIGINYQRLSWRDLAIDIPEDIKEYLENVDKLVPFGLGFTLHGTIGSGKSLLCNLLLKHLIKQGYDGYFTTFSGLLEKFRSGFSSAEEKQWFYKRIKNAQILVIDDIGKEQQQTVFRAKDAVNPVRDDRDIKSNASIQHISTPIAESTLDEILRYRVNQALPTLVTTNFSMEELGEKYGSNIISLLMESNTIIEFEAGDFRRIAAQRKREEALAGLTRPIVL